MSGLIPAAAGITLNRYKSPEYKKLILSDLILTSQKCREKYGSKSVLATDDDPRIEKLCNCWELVLCHGLVETNVASVLKNVTEMVTNGPVELPNFWEFAYIHLLNNERERFSSLQHVWTDRGKTRSLIRSALNERSLQRYLRIWLSDPSLNKSYEPWALMRDAEATEKLATLALELTSVLFALAIDTPELNVLRPVDVAKPEPIIAAPMPSNSASGSAKGSSGKKKSQRQIIDLDQDEGDEGKNGRDSKENLSSQCLLKEEEMEQQQKIPVTPSQVYNIQEELPTEIQTFCLSTPTSSIMSKSLTTSITSERSSTARMELFPEPPSSSCFVLQTEETDVSPLEQNQEKEEEENQEEIEKEETVRSDNSSKKSSVHSSAVSLDVVDVERLKNRLKDAEDRCQQLESRVAELSLENHRLRGLSNSPRGGLTYFTVSVPRVHLENNKYYVYEIIIIPTYGGDEWTVRKRYRDFHELHLTFQRTNAGVKALDFPPKKKFGNMDASFVEQRRQRLQVYLRHLLAILPEVAACNTRTQLEEVFPFFK